MRIQILTLVDITQTTARKGDDPFMQRQQQNFLTIIQTTSLRFNPEVSAAPVRVECDVNDYDFGSAFSGKCSVWKLTLVYEQQVENLLELLKEDFALVPFITNLEESFEFKFPVFDTEDPEHKNLILVERIYKD